jgi:crotonobetainyl-CoA:carnitine CoA-transferase CaiB-like acyl-CoA transferase
MELDHPVAGKMLVTGCPVSLNGEVSHEAAAPPEHGQHTEEILLECDYSWEEIATLRDSEVI